MMKALKRYDLWTLLLALSIGWNARGAKLAEAAQFLPVLQVQVALSPEARKTLMQGNESITVSASWYGWPVPQRQASADEVGQINLGRAEINLPSEGGMVRFTQQMMNTERLSWINGGVYVNVNVWSARRHWPDNILSCDFIDGVLADVGRNPASLHCSLISEKVPNRAVER
jgi:hypothetical protein